MANSCCFCVEGNLHFLDFLQKIFYNIDHWTKKAEHFPCQIKLFARTDLIRLGSRLYLHSKAKIVRRKNASQDVGSMVSSPSQFSRWFQFKAHSHELHSIVHKDIDSILIFHITDPHQPKCKTAKVVLSNYSSQNDIVGSYHT